MLRRFPAMRDSHALQVMEILGSIPSAAMSPEVGMARRRTVRRVLAGYG